MQETSESGNMHSARSHITNPFTFTTNLKTDLQKKKQKKTLSEQKRHKPKQLKTQLQKMQRNIHIDTCVIRTHAPEGNCLAGTVRLLVIAQ
jgi:predicted metal-dependent peptidase